MKFKPKEILVNLPAVHLFSLEDEIPALAAAINTFIHGKIKIKYETIGVLGGQYCGLFYVQRNNESQELREEFLQMIDQEELSAPLDTVEKLLAQEQAPDRDYFDD